MSVLYGVGVAVVEELEEQVRVEPVLPVLLVAGAFEVLGIEMSANPPAESQMAVLGNTPPGCSASVAGR